MAEDAASQPTSADARRSIDAGARAGSQGRAAPPPTPMIPARARKIPARGSGSSGGLVDEIAGRFEADEPGAGDDAEEAEAPEAPETEDEGLLDRLRRRIGFGGNDGDEPEEPEEQAADEPTDAPDDEDEPAEPEPTANDEELDEDPLASEPVSVDVARPTPETGSRPPRPRDAGRRVPARPDPRGADGSDGSRRPLASLAAPGPVPPTGGDPVPAHPDLDGRPSLDEEEGFEDVDVPEPEVLHERVDAVLERHDARRGSR